MPSARKLLNDLSKLGIRAAQCTNYNNHNYRWSTEYSKRTSLLHVFISRVNRRNGVVVRASALQLVDLGFISQDESYQKTSKKVFTASLLGAQHNRDNVENKPGSLLVVSLGMALSGMPPFSCGRQVVGPSSLPIVVALSK